MSFTIKFDDRRAHEHKGFTSFHDWQPDWMFRLKNKFLTIKDGQLYRHYDNSQPRNNFYGVQYTTKFKTIFNNEPDQDKDFKTLVIEGNAAWDVSALTNLAQTTLDKTDFNQRESRFYAPFFKDLTTGDLKGRSVQGIGEIQGNSGTTITFTQVPSGVNIGNELYQNNAGTLQKIGDINAITATTVVVDSIVSTPVNGLFSYAKKSNKYEGGKIRGYFLEVELENDSTSSVEIYGISSNAIKSFV